MAIAVTGASGHLGHLVIESLLARGTSAAEVIAIARTPEKVADLAARGVEVRQADYDEPATLAAALAGVQRLVLVSASVPGSRVAQHRNVIEAARAAGVELIAYTSILRAQTSPMALAGEHAATERLIEESGLPYVFLRNGWYIENYTDNLAPALEHGALVGSAGTGRIAGATRADYAEAAAAAILAGTPKVVHELEGDTPFTMSELAAEVGRQLGREIVYRDLPPADYEQVLLGAGLPEGYAQLLVDSDVNITRGHLATGSDDLRRLIGHPTTPLADAVALAVKG